MSDWFIARVVESDPTLPPSAVLTDFVELGRQVAIERYGHDDHISDTPADLVRRLADHDEEETVILLAVQGPLPADRDAHELPTIPATGDQTRYRVLGDAVSFLSVHDNLHLWWGPQTEVDRDHRRRGIGRALVEASATVARTLDRSTMVSWASHPEAPANAPDALRAPTGVGAISAATPTSRFAQAMGFQLEQTERNSCLDLPPSGDLDALETAAQPYFAGYSLRSWVDRTPADLLEPMCRLHERMSTDAPMGELDIQQEHWTPERIQHAEELNSQLRRTRFETIAIEDATGEPVGYTVIDNLQDKPAVCFQDATLVLSGHRGHRIGMMIKIANLRALMAAVPAPRRVHTWNASENDHMLKINLALGFTTRILEGSWQRRL